MKKNYDPSIDYSKKMEEAAALGDLEQAAFYEEKRNEKIKGEGLSQYAMTHRYEAYLPKTTAKKMEEVFEKLRNREPFTYDVQGDKLYAQYRDSYQKAGTLAREDTAARAAELTGGYGNSYGQTAGQSAYDREMDRLESLIPELYDRAREAYDKEGEGLLEQYDRLAKDLTREQEQAQWEQEQEALEEQREYDRQQQAAKLEREQARWEQEQAYREEQDRLEQSRWEQEQAYREEQDRLEQNRWEREQTNRAEQEAYDREQEERDQAFSLAMEMLMEGLMPSNELMESAGLSAEDAKVLYNAYQKEETGSTGGSGSGSGSGGSSGGSGSGSGGSGGSGSGSGGGSKTNGGSGSGGSSKDSSGNQGKALTNTLWEKLRTTYQKGEKSKDHGEFIQIRSMLVAQGYNVEAFDQWARGIYGKDYTTGKEKTIDRESVLALGYGPISDERLKALVASGEVEEYVRGDYLCYRKAEKKPPTPTVPYQ